MSRYDGLIIPRSYSEYINKTDAATLQQALQLSGVLSGAVASGDNKAVKSSAVNTAITDIKANKVYNYQSSSASDVYIYLFTGGDSWNYDSIDYIKVLEKRVNFAPSLIEFSYTNYTNNRFRYNFNEILQRSTIYGNKIIITNNYKVYLKVVQYSAGRIETNRVLAMEKYTALPTGETEQYIL